LRLARAVIWLPILALLHIHLHHQFHGSEGVYLGLAAGAAASWMGVPGPGEPLLVAAGVLAAQHKLDIGSVIFVAWAGATAGGIGGWLLGRWLGRALITAPGPDAVGDLGAVMGAILVIAVVALIGAELRRRRQRRRRDEAPPTARSGTS
jgi:membrane protein YqaA with SNARE-associated domain